MIYTIKNDTLTAKINSLGAELISVQNNNGKEFIFQPSDIWIGQAKNLFPNIALAKDNYTIIRGKEYPMNQHGFLKTMEMEVTEQTDDTIVFSLENNEETAKFLPYKFIVNIIFALDGDKLTQTFTVKNNDDAPIYFAVGSHTGFISTLKSYVDFGGNDKLTEICREDMQYLNGKEIPFPLEDGKIPVTPKYFEVGAHILNGFSRKEITLVNPELNTSVTIDFDDFNYITLWSTKDAATVLCMMPWCGLPDSLDSNHIFEEKKGNVKLDAQDRFVAKQELTFKELN